MKEIDSQLYGYSYELDKTSEDNGTKCFAVDTGTVFVAYKGVWYEQPGSFWAASIPEGEDDLFGTSWEIGKIVPADDLLVLNVVDTGKRYVSFNGKWYEQPVSWSAPAAGGGGGGLPEVTSDDNGDVLTVVEGVWGKAAPSGVLVVEGSTAGQSKAGEEKQGDDPKAPVLSLLIIHSSYNEIHAALEEGKPVFVIWSNEDTSTAEDAIITGFVRGAHIVLSEGVVTGYSVSVVSGTTLATYVSETATGELVRS